MIQLFLSCLLEQYAGPNCLRMRIIIEIIYYGYFNRYRLPLITIFHSKLVYML